MILNTQPTNATIRNTGSVYSSGGIALNASVALNAYVALGGRDIKFGQKPDSGSISPSGVAGSERPLSPGTMANVAVGGSHFSWVNPDNAKTSSDVYVTSSSNMTPLYDKIVSLILADGSHGTASAPVNGGANTGNGGSGSNQVSYSGDPGSGGSGIVVIRYLISDVTSLGGNFLAFL